MKRYCSVRSDSRAEPQATPASPSRLRREEESLEHGDVRPPPPRMSLVASPGAVSAPRMYAEQEVDAALHRRLIKLLSTCFHGPHSGSFRVQSYCWVPPTRRWICFDGERPVAHLAVHDKQLGTAEGDLRAGVIGDVCTLPAYRGQGHVRHMLQAVHEWLVAQGVAFAMLFGRATFYGSSGYRPVHNRIRHQDFNTKEWKTEVLKDTMVCSLDQRAWPDGEIDLRGPKL